MYTNKRLNKNKSVSINITAGVQKLNKIIIMNRVLKESVHPNYNTNNLNNNKKETNIKNDSGRPCVQPHLLMHHGSRFMRRSIFRACRVNNTCTLKSYL